MPPTPSPLHDSSSPQSQQQPAMLHQHFPMHCGSSPPPPLSTRTHTLKLSPPPPALTHLQPSMTPHPRSHSSRPPGCGTLCSCEPHDPHPLFSPTPSPSFPHTPQHDPDQTPQPSHLQTPHTPPCTQLSNVDNPHTHKHTHTRAHNQPTFSPP